MNHPVLDVLRARLREDSTPGRRSDPYRVAVVMEGGGMRGVVSAGMTAALEGLGLTRCFDLVVGSSAGALNAAALLGGVARPAAAMYYTVLASKQFVNPVRLLFGKPALDVRFVLASSDPPPGVAEAARRAGAEVVTKSELVDRLSFVAAA